jgi:hypothetical protein
VEDLLHIAKLSHQRRHWSLEDWAVIAQLLEERKRIASELVHDELELLDGYLPWIPARRCDRVERSQDWADRVP